MHDTTLMLIGLGNVGGPLLDLLAQEPSIGRIVACSKQTDKGEARCNLARLTAASTGCLADIEYSSVDLTDQNRVGELVDRFQPDIIISTASLQTWWLTELLPEPSRARLEAAKLGAWLPVHLALNLALMQALKTIGFDRSVLTASFPDVVNAILGCLDLAPTCGVGNVDEMATKVQLLAAKERDVPIEAIEVSMVGHHALERAAFGGSEDSDHPPYFLRVLQDGVDISDSCDADRLLFEPMTLPGGPAWSIFTGASTLRLIRAILSENESRLHAPAPQGLPGGYPIEVGRGSLRVAEIPGLDLNEAIAINERSHPFDGISHIEADGTAVMTPDSAEIMRSELGYDCERLRPDEAMDRAQELMTRFREYARRNGVDVDRR